MSNRVKKQKGINQVKIIKIFTLLSIILLLTTLIIPLAFPDNKIASSKKQTDTLMNNKNNKQDENIRSNENDLKIKTCGNYGEGYRYNIQGWVYIHIEGEPYERGYQYGYLASEEIVDMMVRWSNWGHNQKILRKLPVDVNSPRYDKISERWWEYCKSKAKRWFLKHYPEEYIEEMRGVADGVRDQGGMIHGNPVGFDDILTTNEIVDCWFSYEFAKKVFHPFRGLLSGISNLFSKDQSGGSCSAFMATGSATVDGEIIVGHSTHIPKYYIPERFNIILDVEPSKGHRFIMACPPGTIHSMTDYHQNEKGILLVETTLYPQGPFKMNGVPIGVRTRQAIQYSDSIDEVIKYLKDGNNGLYGCEWLIGDTKSGEIASIELALFNTPVKRTKNGFYYSCNSPHDPRVQGEIYGIPPILVKIGRKILPDLFLNDRAKKFQEIEKEYYGKIDLEIAKDILGTYPICYPSSDGKITSSKLMKNLGLLAYMGNPNGTKWTPSSTLENKLKGITELPASGWVEIYGTSCKPNNLITPKNQYEPLKKSKLVWRSKTSSKVNDDYTSISISDDVIYTGNPSGLISAYTLDGENEIWKKSVKGNIVATSVSYNNMYAGSNEALYSIDKDTGEIKWAQNVISVSSTPVYTEDLVIISCSDGGVYAFDSDSGDKLWQRSFSYPAYLSDIKENHIYIGSGDTCYNFDIRNKRIIWEKKTDGIITSSPRVKGKMVYLGSWDGNIYALDSNSGKIKWSYETGWGIDTTPYVSNGIVYVGSLDNNLYALNEETGKLEWHYTCKSAIHSSPIVYGEYVFFGCDDGHLYALDKYNGDLAWNYAPGYTISDDNVNNYISTPIISDPIVRNGQVYINIEGTVYALDSQTAETPTVYEEKVAESNIMYLLSTVFICLSLIGAILLYVKRKKK